MGKTRKEIVASAVRAAVPPAIVAIVWYVTLHILRYTLLMQEQKGLFLMTTDYFREVFSGSWPVTTLISDFLVQFYSKPVLGSLLTGLIVAKVYLMVCTIFRFTSFRQIVGGIGAALTINWLGTEKPVNHTRSKYNETQLVLLKIMSLPHWTHW